MVIQPDIDLVALINAGSERPDLDYKEKINLEGTKKEKAEIAKDIIAIANSGGGFIIGGVKEGTSGFLRIGMSPEELRCFDSTKLNQFVNNYCDPPINSTTKIVEVEGKPYGAIIVPEFGEQPHIIVKSFDGVFNEADIFVRTENNESRRAGPYEVRQLIEKCVTRRQGVLQRIVQAAFPQTIPQIISNAPKQEVAAPIDTKEYLDKYTGFRIVRIHPVTDRPLIGLRNLKSLIEKAYIIDGRTREVSFPPAVTRYSAVTDETRLPTGILYRHQSEEYQSFSVSYFDMHGLVYTVDSLWEDMPDNRYGQGALGVTSCIRALYESLLFAKLYYAANNWVGRLAIRFSLESSIPRRLMHDTRNSLPLFRNYQNSLSAPVAVTGEFDTAIDLAGIEKLVTEMMLEFFWFFNYDLDEPNFYKYMDYVKKNGLNIPDTLNKSDQTGL